MTSLNLDTAVSMGVEPSDESVLPKLPAIQTLRGFAAAMVVFHHTAGYVASNNINPSWFIKSRLSVVGAAGVDIFFVISGFIMFYTTTRKTERRDAGTFLWRRTVRIFPLYWLWTTVLVLIAASKLIKVNHAHRVYYFVASYFLIPAYSGYSYQPFLNQGWTLSFEMLFYLVFAVGIWLKRRESMLSFLCASFTVLLLASLLLPSESGIRYLLSNTLILEFLFGVGLAKLLLGRKVDSERRATSLWISAAPIGLGCLLLLSTSFISSQGDWIYGSPWRFVYWGAPSAIIVFGFASWEQKLANRTLVYLGDASYTTYLSHIFLLRGLLTAFDRIGGLRSFPVDAEILAATILILLLTLPAFEWIERPLTSLLAGAKLTGASFLPSRS